MRSLTLFIVVIVVVLFAFPGCDPSTNPVEVKAPVSEEDAAALIGAALAGNQSTGGLTAQMQEILTVAKGGPLPKISGVVVPQVDTTIVLQKTDGLYTYDYTLYLSYAFASANLLQVQLSMKGEYDTPTMSSADSCAGAVEVTNILAGDILTFNGTYDRFGSQQLKNENKDAFESTINARLANVNVSKTTELPVSGTITFEVAITHSTGAGVTFIAVVRFNNDETATVSVNTKTFTVNLLTGFVLPA